MYQLVSGTLYRLQDFKVTSMPKNDSDFLFPIEIRLLILTQKNKELIFYHLTRFFQPVPWFF